MYADWMKKISLEISIEDLEIYKKNRKKINK